ncbi:MAG TPA: phage tail protein, partial [Myxococcota bacterium]|nr:phage tail protein [Myxococcota bacterium]
MQVTAVPTTTRKPGAYMNIDTSGARLGLAAIPDRVLLVGVKTSAGTATALVAKQIYSAAEARTAFGPGSPLALMVAAFLAQHPNAAELWAI